MVPGALKMDTNSFFVVRPKEISLSEIKRSVKSEKPDVVREFRAFLEVLYVLY